MESLMSALLLLLVPPLSALLAVAAPSLADLAWPSGSSSMRKLIAKKVAPEQAARNELLRVARYSSAAASTVQPGGGEECVVCLSGIEEGDEVRELRCRHLFHRGCLDRWLSERPPATCPLCRCRLLQTSAAADDDVDGDGDGEEDTDLVLFMAYLRSSSTWL
uniref:RING-type domain-containing protein n=1 Tax=Oryza punctata TaxID=4537 RepID=A0A0E0LPY4_ORYPU